MKKSESKMRHDEVRSQAILTSAGPERSEGLGMLIDGLN
jgi:hypothetical protein